MGVLILPSRRIWKPPLGVQIDWGHPLSQSLVACWLMNEGAGFRVLDLCGRHHGTANNMAGSSTSGWGYLKDGSALVFDGVNDNVSVPHNAVLVSPTLSVAVIFKTTDTGAYRGLMDKGWGTGQQGYIMDIHSDSLRFSIAGPAAYYIVEAGAVADGKIHCAVGTFDNSSAILSIYLDYVLKATKSSSVLAASTDILYIGGDGVSTNYLNGTIGLVVIWSRALTHSDVQSFTAEPYCFLQPVIRRFYSIPEEIKVMNRIYLVRQQSPTIPVRQLGI